MHGLTCSGCGGGGGTSREVTKSCTCGASRSAACAIVALPTPTPSTNNHLLLLPRQFPQRARAKGSQIMSSARVSVLLLLALVGCAAAACPKGMKAVTNKQRRQAEPVGYEVRRGSPKSLANSYSDETWTVGLQVSLHTFGTQN